MRIEGGYGLEGTGQWVKGKSADTFAPLGPFLATRDEIADPHALPMWLKVNGVSRHNPASLRARSPVAVSTLRGNR